MCVRSVYEHTFLYFLYIYKDSHLCVLIGGGGGGGGGTFANDGTLITGTLMTGTLITMPKDISVCWNIDWIRFGVCFILQ